MLRIGAVLACLVLTAPLAAAEWLVADGASAYSLVVGWDATPAERTAALELKHFLREITGVELPVHTEARGPSIHLGQSEAARRAFGLADWTELRPDEILLKTVDGDLYLAGHRPAGTLYAVYELLEEAWGVRFWTARATHVPRLARLDVPALDVRYAPPFEVRSAGCALACHDMAFALRTRNNGHGVGTPPVWGGHVDLLGGVHTFSENDPLIPAERYFADHPEWFAQDADGHRRERHTQLCLSNAGLRAELTRRVLERLREHPGARYISVSQNDSGDTPNYCVCDNCAAFVAEHGNQSDLLLLAVNEVADAVAREFPGVYVETLGYRYTRTPPKTVMPRDNVIVRYCTIEQASFHPLESDANRALVDDLVGWGRAARQIMIWNYVTDFHKYYQPHPNWNALAPDLRRFRDNGAISIYEQGPWNGGRELADLGDLRAWLLSRLLWNPDRDADALIDEFVAGYYGPAAATVRGYIDAMNAAVARHPENREDCYAKSTSAWLDAETLAEQWRRLDAAARDHTDDPVLGPRLAAAAVPIGCALAERPELFLPPREQRPEALRDATLDAVIADTYARIKTVGEERLAEGPLSPEEWRERALQGSRFANAGLSDRPLAGLPDGARYYAVALHQVAHQYNLGGDLFLDADPAASDGQALRMPNNHTWWRVQAFSAPSGEYDIYVEARCDSERPAGDVLRAGVYDWSARTEFFVDLPAARLAGTRYGVFPVGRARLKSDTCVFFAPVVNPASRQVWLDRLILVPVP